VPRFAVDKTEPRPDARTHRPAIEVMDHRRHSTPRFGPVDHARDSLPVLTLRAATTGNQKPRLIYASLVLRATSNRLLDPRITSPLRQIRHSSHDRIRDSAASPPATAIAVRRLDIAVSRRPVRRGGARALGQRAQNLSGVSISCQKTGCGSLVTPASPIISLMSGLLEKNCWKDSESG
jgi:hypothetical protein